MKDHEPHWSGLNCTAIKQKLPSRINVRGLLIFLFIVSVPASRVLLNSDDSFDDTDINTTEDIYINNNEHIVQKEQEHQTSTSSTNSASSLSQNQQREVLEQLPSQTQETKQNSLTYQKSNTTGSSTLNINTNEHHSDDISLIYKTQDVNYNEIDIINKLHSLDSSNQANCGYFGVNYVHSNNKSQIKSDTVEQPPILAGYTHSGTTFTRLLIEYLTKYHTGLYYTDQFLSKISKFTGNQWALDKFAVIMDQNGYEDESIVTSTNDDEDDDDGSEQEEEEDDINTVNGDNNDFSIKTNDNLEIMYGYHNKNDYFIAFTVHPEIEPAAVGHSPSDYLTNPYKFITKKNSRFNYNTQGENAGYNAAKHRHSVLHNYFFPQGSRKKYFHQRFIFLIRNPFDAMFAQYQVKVVRLLRSVDASYRGANEHVYRLSINEWDIARDESILDYKLEKHLKVYCNQWLVSMHWIKALLNKKILMRLQDFQQSSKTHFPSTIKTLITKVNRAILNFTKINDINFDISKEIYDFRYHMLIIKFENLVNKKDKQIRIDEYDKIIQFLFEHHYYNENKEYFNQRMILIDSVIYNFANNPNVDRFSHVDFDFFGNINKFNKQFDHFSCLDVFFWRLKSIHRVTDASKGKNHNNRQNQQNQRNSVVVEWQPLTSDYAWKNIPLEKLCQAWKMIKYYATMFNYELPSDLTCL